MNPPDAMQAMLDLDDDAVCRIVQSAEPTLQERFETWLMLNPGIVPLFTKLALEMKHQGHQRGSIKLIAEVARWHILTGRAVGDDFAVNNSYVSRLARLLMETVPELEDFFELRELRSV